MVHTTHRRTIITQDNLVEKKVNMSNVSFVSDSSAFATGTSSGPASWFNSISRTASSYKTILITIGVAVALLAVATIPARRMWRGSSEMGGINIYNTNDNNNDADGGAAYVNAEQHLPALLEPAVLPGPAAVLPGPAAAEQEEEEEPEEVEERRLEIWQILKKPVHLRTPAERIAADDWARVQDPFQLQA